MKKEMACETIKKMIEMNLSRSYIKRNKGNYEISIGLSIDDSSSITIKSFAFYFIGDKKMEKING